jgi:type IV pilus assembly protein PilV
MSIKGAQALRRSSGFTLMEILIAMVVMGVGIITITELQTNALTGSQQSSARMQAAILASGMADRIRANPQGNNGTGTYTREYDGTDPTSAPTPDCYQNQNTCDPAELATHDVWRWQQKLANSLPGGEGIVCRDGADNDYNDGTGPTNPSCSGNAANNPLAVKIWWTRKATEEGKTADTRQFTLTFEP